MKVKVLLIKADLEIVHDFLLKKKLSPIFLPSIPDFQKMKAYGIVKRVSKCKGGFQQFKKDYQRFIENNYYIFRKPLDENYIDV
jgi:hypothetical protein